MLKLEGIAAAIKATTAVTQAPEATQLIPKLQEAAQMLRKLMKCPAVIPLQGVPNCCPSSRAASYTWLVGSFQSSKDRPAVIQDPGADDQLFGVRLQGKTIVKL
jgi:hypothetical protein